MAIDGTSCLPGSETERASQLRFDDGLKSGMALPEPIQRVLNQLDRRVRRLGATRVLGSVLGISAIGIAGGLALDTVFLMTDTVRWRIWLGQLTALGLLLTLRLLPVIRHRDRLTLAALTEGHKQPSRQSELLTAAIALAQAPDGSQSLISGVILQASELAQTLDICRIIPGRPPTRRLFQGIGLLCLLILPATGNGTYRAWLIRQLNPWANLGRPGGFHVRILTATRFAARGQPLRITASSEPSRRQGSGMMTQPEMAWLEWIEDDGGRKSALPQRLSMRLELDSSENRLLTSDDRTDIARTSPRRFSATIPGPTASFQYRVIVERERGSSRGTSSWFDWISALPSLTTITTWSRIVVSDPPILRRVAARIESPDYIGGSPAAVLNPDRIQVWQDSRVMLEIDASTTARDIQVEFAAETNHRPGEFGQPDSRKPGSSVQTLTATLTADRRSGLVEIPTESSAQFSITLTDLDGLISLPEIPRRLIVKRDAPPELQLGELEPGNRPEEPTETMEIRPDEQIALTVQARDDIAIAEIDVDIETERMPRIGSGETADHPPDARELPATSPRGPDKKRLPISLNGLGSTWAQGEAVLDLVPLGLASGDRLSYRVRVADNRPAPRGPNVVWSPSRTLVVSRRARSLRERRSEAQRRKLQDQIDRLRELAARLRQGTEQLRYAADAALRGNGPWTPARQQELAERKHEAAALANGLRQMGREEQDDPDQASLAPEALKLAQNQAEPAHDALEEARKKGHSEKSPDADGRLEELRRADTHLAAVTAGLEGLRARSDKQSKAGDREGQASSVPVRNPGANNPGRSGQNSTAKSQSGSPGRGLDAKAINGAQGGNPTNQGAGKENETAGQGTDEIPGEAGSGHVWGELPGRLRTEILQTPSSRYRQEYADQIQRYYRAIARVRQSLDGPTQTAAPKLSPR